MSATPVACAENVIPAMNPIVLKELLVAERKRSAKRRRSGTGLARALCFCAALDEDRAALGEKCAALGEKCAALGEKCAALDEDRAALDESCDALDESCAALDVDCSPVLHCAKSWRLMSDGDDSPRLGAALAH